MTDHLAIVLPGGNNDPWTAPVLLPSLALEEVGAKVERVSYDGAPKPQGLTREASAEFNAALLKQVTALVDRHAPDRVTFVAKSRGALFLAAVDEASIACEVAAIWVTTPLVDLDEVREGVIEKSWRSLLVAGGADPYHDPVGHAEIGAALRADELVIPGANHGLVVEGDVLATVEGYRRLAEASLEFARATG